MEAQCSFQKCRDLIGEVGTYFKKFLYHTAGMGDALMPSHKV